MNEKFLQSLQNDQNTEYQETFRKAARLVKKWERSGLLKELKNDYDRHTVSTLLENQSKQLLREMTKGGTTAGSEEWSGIALPLVRRIFAQISAKEFVSIQSMQQPSGLVFYLEFRYGTNQPGFTTTAGASGQANSIYGITNQAGDPTGGLYGVGRFGYSTNDKTVTGGAFVTSSVNWQDVDFKPELSASVSQGSQLRKVTVTLGSVNFDASGVRAFAISGSNIKTYFPQFTQAVDETGAASTTKVTFLVSGSGIVTDGANTVNYHVQPIATNRGDFEASGDPAYTDISSTNALDIPEINIDMKSDPIVAKTKKLKAVWTPEMSQDMMSYHTVDAEKELTSILSDYISMEIDLEILDMLIVNAATKDYWNAEVGKIYQAGSDPWFNTQDNVMSKSMFYNQMSWYQTLGIKATKMSNAIHQKTMRGGANFMTISPTVATVIESIPGFAADTDGTAQEFGMGVQQIGKMANRWKVYKNPYMTENVALMGYKGTQFLETGAAYCPYIPFIMTPIIYDPQNMTPRKGIMTRYAKKMVRPEFYGKIIIAGTNTI